MSDLIRAIYIISDNPNFTPVVEALGTEISTALLPSLGALETMELYQVLLYALHEEGQYDPPRSLREKVAPIKQTILTVVDKDNHHISENQAELGAICTVAHFFSPENMADPTSISYEEFKSYFGLS